MAAHRYWRYLVSATAAGTAVIVAETELRATVGGADQTAPGGTATASSTYDATATTAAAGAVANDSDVTGWMSALSGADVGAWWWAYDFGSAVTVAQISITASYSAGFGAYSPTAFKIQHSDNGSSWVDNDSISGQSWTDGETKLFSVTQDTSAAATPTCSPAAGSYATTQSVTLACTSPSPTIYYTVDGTTPTTGSPVYSGAISVSAYGPTTIKALATSSGLTDSAVATFVFGISPISYVGKGTASNTSAYSLTVTPTVPAAAVTGDLIIVVANSYLNAAISCTANPGSPAFAEVATQLGGTNYRVGCWWRVVQAGESGAVPTPTFSVSGTANKFTAQAFVFRGCDPTTPIDVAGSFTANAAAATWTGATVSIATHGAMLMFAGGSVDDNNWGTWGGGIDSGQFVANAASTLDNSIFLGYNSAAGLQDTGTCTAPTAAQTALGNDAGARLTFALRPLPAVVSWDHTGTAVTLAGAGVLGAPTATRAVSGAAVALAGTAALGTAAGSKAASGTCADLAGSASLGLATGTAAATTDARTGTATTLAGSGTLGAATGSKAASGTAADLAATGALGSASGAKNLPSFRSGFPLVVNHASAAAPYTLTTSAFSATAGDELVAIASAYARPVVSGSSLKWVQRALVRSYQPGGGGLTGQTALWTAKVPLGGVAGETATLSVSATANPGGQSTPSAAAQLQVFAFDNSNGVGAIGWCSSTQSAATSTASVAINTFSAYSLVLVGGGVWDGGAFAADANSALVGSVSNAMGVVQRAQGGAAGALTVGTNQSASANWEMVAVEILPATATRPTKNILCLGDSLVEGSNSTLSTPVALQDLFAGTHSVYGCGVWWEHTAQTLARWTSELASSGLHFDVIWEKTGSNDLADSGALDRTNQANLWTALLAHGPSKLIVGPYLPTNLNATYQAGITPQQASDDAWIRANYPASNPAVVLQDLNFYVDGTGAPITAYFAPDSTHMSAAGNQAQAVVLRSEILSGTCVSLTAAATLGPATGTASLSTTTRTGTAATLSAAAALDTATGTRAVSGTTAALAASATLGVPTATRAVSGTVADLTATATLGAATGTSSTNEARSGTATTLAATSALGTAAGTRAGAGTGLDLAATSSLGMAAGARAASGTAVTLSASSSLGTADGTRAVSGTAAALTATAALSTATGTAATVEARSGTATDLSATGALSAATGTKAVAAGAQALTGAAALDLLGGSPQRYGSAIDLTAAAVLFPAVGHNDTGPVDVAVLASVKHVWRRRSWRWPSPS